MSAPPGLSRRRVAIARESSMPCTGTPRAASGRAMRPVPMPNSSAAPSPASDASTSTTGSTTAGSNMSAAYSSYRAATRSSKIPSSCTAQRTLDGAAPAAEIDHHPCGLLSRDAPAARDDRRDGKAEALRLADEVAAQPLGDRTRQRRDDDLVVGAPADGVAHGPDGVLAAEDRLHRPVGGAAQQRQRGLDRPVGRLAALDVGDEQRERARLVLG